MISDFHTEFRHDMAPTTVATSSISYRPNVSKTLIVSKLIELLLKPPILFLLRGNLSHWIELKGGAQMIYQFSANADFLCYFRYISWDKHCRFHFGIWTQVYFCICGYSYKLRPHSSSVSKGKHQLLHSSTADGWVSAICDHWTHINRCW